MLHAVDGALTFVPYGQGAHEVIYSVSRPDLNRILIDAAERAGVEIRFRTAAVGADIRHRSLVLRDEVSGRLEECPLQRVIAADGAGSVVRRALVERARSAELRGAAEARLQGTASAARCRRRAHQIEKHALHIWPRGGFMLIALPNLDGSFTVTLFLPHHGEESFASLTEPARITQFFRRHFPDVCATAAGADRRVPAASHRHHGHGALRALVGRGSAAADRRCRARDHAVPRPGHELRVRGLPRAGRAARRCDRLGERVPPLRRGAPAAHERDRRHGDRELPGDARHGARSAVPSAAGAVAGAGAPLPASASCRATRW